MPSPSNFILFLKLILRYPKYGISFCKWVKLVEFTLVAKKKEKRKKKTPQNSNFIVEKMTNFVGKKLMQLPRSISWLANQKQLFSFIGPFLYFFCILMIGSNSISNYLEFVSMYWGRLFVCLFVCFCFVTWRSPKPWQSSPHHWLLCCWKALNEGAPRWVLQCIDQS